MKASSQSAKERFWREQLNLIENYPGTTAEFCRSKGLPIYTCHYWRKKIATQQRPMAHSAVVQNPFIQVEVQKRAEPVASSLPDPRWLAEFLIQLNRGAR